MSGVHTAEFIGTNCDKRIDKLMGHWLYVRRCETPDPKYGIVLPDWTKSYSLWNEVLAIGTDVARPRDWPKRLLEERGVPRCMDEYYRVGDIALVSDNLPPWSIRHSPFANDEFFIDECVFICAYREPIDEYSDSRLSHQTEESCPT